MPTSLAARTGAWSYDTMTVVGEGTWEAARAAIDVALTAADLVVEGSPAAYACCRPPGHHVTRSAFNAIVRMTAVINGQPVTQVRQLIGPGGHNGKIVDQLVHFGLGAATEAAEIRIEWSSTDVAPTVLHNVKPGLHAVTMSAR
jgi:hypothetical protein